MIKPTIVPLLFLALCALHTPARSGPYDLIIADSFDLTLPQGGIQALDFGLIVNTGAAAITHEDLELATFFVKASRPEIEFRPSINSNNPQIVGDIQPGEAVGNIQSGNQLLLPLLRPGETMRNVGVQFMSFFVWREGNTYEGPVDFDVTMVMAGFEARFTMRAQVHFGEPQLQYLTATRISAFPATVPNCRGASANPQVLWPANGQLVPVDIVGVTDPQGDPVEIVVTEITQDEPVISGNSGRSRRECFDGRIVEGAAEVRAQRDPGGNGRVYIIRFTASDPQGGACNGHVLVCVPPGPKESCVLDPEPYNSLGNCGPAPLAALRPLTIEPSMKGRTLEYALAQASDVTFELFDLAGRRVSSVAEGLKPAGRHVVRWSSDLGRGVYFVRIRAGEQVEARRLLLIRD